MGIGKLIEIEGTKAKVEWFKSVAEHVSHPHVAEYDIKLVERDFPSPQTRCYITNEHQSEWRMGRITQSWQTEDGTGIEYDIDFSGGTAAYIPEHLVFVRCEASSVDPIETLIYRAQETPFFHYHRARFLNSIIQQRATAHGLTGLVSSRIELYPHQIEVARRVLEDPIQRYLLADEVGLGKTIEAGIILRQNWLDDPSSRMLVIVPAQLTAQWRCELKDKFSLDVDGKFISICSTDEVGSLNSSEPYDIVVIDEAHHVASALHGTNNRLLWSKCLKLAHEATKLLLISATPALHHEEDFLAMLHMLDPKTYQLSDLDAFRERVSIRQKVGRLLLLLRENLERTELRICLNTMRDIFNQDQWVMEQVSALQRLCDSEEYYIEEINRLVRLVRVHICEIYRIYRRMLRTSRASLAENTLIARAKRSDHPSIIIEWGFDDRLPRILELVEEWRTTAVSYAQEVTTSGRDALEQQLSEIFFILVEASGTWLNVLERAIECRLSGLRRPAAFKGFLGDETIQKLLSLPLMKDEDTILHAILRELSRVPEDGDQIFWLSEVVKQHCTARRRCVVFCTRTAVAQEIVRRLRTKYSSRVVLEHTIENRKDSLEALDIFERQDGPTVLVCDQSGEEGLNLQCSDVIVHFDVPWSPNRLEQRIGRVDRIGRKDELHSHIFVHSGSNGFSIHEAWYQILNHGFRIFSESVADLQFYIDRIMPDLKKAAFSKGVDGILEKLQTISEDIQRERRVLREQSALDEIEAFDRDYVDFRTNLDQYDARWHEIQDAFDGWAVDALRMKRQVTEDLLGDQDGIDLKTRPFVRYTSKEKTLVPRDWLQTIFASEPGVVSFMRQAACRVPSVSIMRIGHSVVDGIVRYINWDDRGQAFVMWRHVAKSDLESNQIYFELDYVIDTNMGPVINVLQEIGWGSTEQSALSRRADAWFPPQKQVLYLDEKLKIVTQPGIIQILKTPYISFDKGGTDYNLDGKRQSVLDGIVSPDRWPELCRNVRSVSEDAIRSDKEFQKYCNKSAKCASEDLDRQIEQLRMGLIYHSRPRHGSTQKCDLGRSIEDERRLYEAVIQGIEHPKVKLDAVGVFILSSLKPAITER